MDGFEEVKNRFIWDEKTVSLFNLCKVGSETSEWPIGKSKIVRGTIVYERESFRHGREPRPEWEECIPSSSRGDRWGDVIFPLKIQTRKSQKGKTDLNLSSTVWPYSLCSTKVNKVSRKLTFVGKVLPSQTSKISTNRTENLHTQTSYFCRRVWQ